MKSAVVGRAVIKPSTASFSFFRSLVHGGKPDIYGINDKLFCFLHGILVIGQAVRCPFLLYFAFQKKFFAKCPWQAVFFPVCEYAAVELPYLFQCGFTNTPDIIKNMTPEQLNEKVNEALENNESENIRRWRGRWKTSMQKVYKHTWQYLDVHTGCQFSESEFFNQNHQFREASLKKSAELTI